MPYRDFVGESFVLHDHHSSTDADANANANTHTNASAREFATSRAPRWSVFCGCECVDYVQWFRIVRSGWDHRIL